MREHSKGDVTTRDKLDCKGTSGLAGSVKEM